MRQQIERSWVLNNIEFLGKNLEMDFESAVKHVENTVIRGNFNVMLVKSIDEIIETTAIPIDISEIL